MKKATIKESAIRRGHVTALSPDKEYDILSTDNCAAGAFAIVIDDEGDEQEVYYQYIETIR